MQNQQVEDLLTKPNQPPPEAKHQEKIKEEKEFAQETADSAPQIPLPSNSLISKQKRRLLHLHSLYEVPILRSDSVIMDNFQRIMENNKTWQKAILKEDPSFFDGLVEIQKPQYLWIGCADSRVPANQICGLKAGQIFVHRNVANQAPPSDINFLAVLQYAVQVLKVQDIIVSGHYGCGGVKAAFKKHDHGPLESWLSHIRDLRWRYRKELIQETQEANQNLLCELNVKQQVYNIARVPIVQQAWKEKRQLRIHGLIYNLKDGLLKDLGITLDHIHQIPEEFVITD